jgi:hypothetical protein
MQLNCWMGGLAGVGLCMRQAEWVGGKLWAAQTAPSKQPYAYAYDIVSATIHTMYLVSWLTKRQTTHAGFIVKFNGASWNQVSAMLSRFSLTLPLSPRPAPSACTRLKRKLLPDAPAQYTHTGSEITFVHISGSWLACANSNSVVAHLTW